MNLVGSFSLGALFAVGVFLLVIKYYFPTYFAEKGKI
jgi:hypothetical protein